MGYTKKSGRYADTTDANLNPLSGATVTVDGYSQVLEMGDRATARLNLKTTAVTGSGAVLDVTVQTSKDGVTWYTSGTFTQVANTVDTTWDQRKIFTIDRFVRALFDVTGTTPVITVTLLGECC